jgi:hypothetical protein
MAKLSNLEFFTKVAETGEAPADGFRVIETLIRNRVVPSWLRQDARCSASA